MKSHLAALLVLSAAPPATALAQPAGPRPGPAEAAAAGETLTPHEAQVRRAAAIKSGDKAAIAKAGADEDAAFAKWRRDHPAAAAVTPKSKAAHQAELARLRAKQKTHAQP